MAGAQKAKDPHPKAPLWEQQLQAARDITQKHLAGIMDGAAFDAQIVRVKHQFEASRDAMYPGWRERYDREFVAWVERRSH